MLTNIVQGHIETTRYFQETWEKIGLFNVIDTYRVTNHMKSKYVQNYGGFSKNETVARLKVKTRIKFLKGIEAVGLPTGKIETVEVANDSR